MLGKYLRNARSMFIIFSPWGQVQGLRLTKIGFLLTQWSYLNLNPIQFDVFFMFWYLMAFWKQTN